MSRVIKLWTNFHLRKRKFVSLKLFDLFLSGNSLDRTLQFLYKIIHRSIYNSDPVYLQNVLGITQLDFLYWQWFPVK